MNNPSSQTKLEWIKVGYEIFGRKGPAGLKVQSIARELGRNKSSFYHYFGDLELYILELMEYHKQRTLLIAEEREKCGSLIPDFIHQMILFKEEILFVRQLRINCNIDIYNNAFLSCSQQTLNVSMKLWADGLGIDEDSKIGRIFLLFIIEHFFSYVNEETLNYEDLLMYFHKVKSMINEFDKLEMAS